MASRTPRGCVDGNSKQHQKGLTVWPVAPHVGAWIEISGFIPEARYTFVAPHVGAWIEITDTAASTQDVRKSHPTWVRGLKSYQSLYGASAAVSHPTWVRGLKFPVSPRVSDVLCRTPRGCVD